MSRRATVLLAVLTAFGLVAGVWRRSGATFTDGTGNPANVLSAAVLQPATGLTVTNLSGSRAGVTWTATSSTFAAGYYVYRTQTSGCCYTLVSTETPRTDTSFNDPGVSKDQTYYYIVTAYVQNWTSPSTPEVAITID